ncbi:hypothetical protein ACJMK2_036314 [Sinanodonta woodiana]|uniref:Apple domain-containing protein n=1 Tax=Sinanodonta woodiana TaxID=1069815 RepID=A0ABD3WGU2_SINWO
MSPQTFSFYSKSLQFLIHILLCCNEAKREFRTTTFLKLEGYRVTNIYKTINATRVQCCGQCLEDNKCASVNVREDSTYPNCDINQMSPVAEAVSIVQSANWNVFYMDNDPWKLVFRVTAGGGTNPYYAWQNGTGTLDSENCMMLYPSSCTKYYRNKLLDTWTTWPIEKVKFALYKNHAQVAYIVFDGTGSDMESWFSKQRVVASSWSDIIESKQMLYFSVQGDSLRGRYFFIHEAYGGCNIDVGWTVTAFGIQVPCTIDMHASYPGLVYAKNGTKALYSSQGYGVADVLAVYVKLQEE